MHPDPRPRRPWRAALAAAAAVLVATSLVAAVALGMDLRREVARTGAPLARTADELARTIDPARPVAARAALAGTGADARLLGPAGRVRAQAGPGGAVWEAGDAGWAGALATMRAEGWTLVDGAVEARRTLPSGAQVVLREPLAPGAGTLGASAAPVAWAIGIATLLAGLIGWLLAARRNRHLREAATALESLAAGRPPALPTGGRGEWARLDGAVAGMVERAADLQAAAEARMDALGAALAPLDHPVAARTPSGGLIRNDALERLVAGLAPADAGQVDDAVRQGLATSGPVARRLVLSDGRVLEMEAWAVPGGRVVGVGERTEQARLAAMRLQITGAAARHLQAPVSEIQALGSDLVGQVPPSGATVVRRIQAAADRMERLVAQLLRGTANDPRARPLRMRAVGAAGIAYGLGAAFDRQLRDRGLRLETSLPSDLPPMRTDSALLHEILSELIANAARFTPRGGTITLGARQLPGARVELTVTDTGPGVRGEEVHLVTERFARGTGAAGFPGAGLGLGVASALAERLGGRLTIDAGPGGRARLELPAALAPAAAPEGDPEPVLSGVAAPAP
ncbi:MAG: ATP-binding protein [Thermoleophilia bacterium]